MLPTPIYPNAEKERQHMNIYSSFINDFILDLKEWCKDNPLKQEDYNNENSFKIRPQFIWLGRKHSIETIEKMKKVDKSYMQTEEYKSKLSLAKKDKPNPKLKNRVFSEEHRRKISESKKGQKTRLGAVLSDETKLKISNSQKKRLSTFDV